MRTLVKVTLSTKIKLGFCTISANLVELRYCTGLFMWFCILNIDRDSHLDMRLAWCASCTKPIYSNFCLYILSLVFCLLIPKAFHLVDVVICCGGCFVVIGLLLEQLIDMDDIVFFQRERFLWVLRRLVAFRWIVPWLQFSWTHEQESQRAQNVCSRQNSKHNLPLAVCLL